ncbi:MAG TPA: ABC transporter permease [Thermoanaerobaculia bacterium]
MMSNLLLELRQAARTLAKAPGFTLISALILALGIGANSAVFSIVEGVLLKPLPYRDSGRLVQLWTQFPEDGLLQNPFSPAEFLDYRKESKLFESMSAYLADAVVATGPQPERLQMVLASAELWPTLGVNAALGRTFLPDEDRPGYQAVVVLSHGFWQRRFGSDAGIVGRKIVLDGSPYTIIGVMPAGFGFPEPKVELWAPLALDPATVEGRTRHMLSVVGRLRPGATVDQVRADMKVIADRWAQEYEHAHPMTALTLREQILGDVSRPLLVLLGTVLLVLLIACANIAGLLLAQSQRRWREMALRSALGASRGRLVRQLLLENALLALLGATLGLLLSSFALKLLVALDPGDLPRLDQVYINLRVLGFTLGLSLLTILAFGLIPALRASRPDLNAALKEGAGGPAPGSVRHKLRGGLVVVEIAVATMLVIGAFLLLRSFWNLQSTPPGFRSDHLLTARISSLPSARYPEPYQLENFFAELNRRLAALPGVRSASQVDRLPLWQDLVVERFEIVGQSYAPGETPSTRIQVIDPHFFSTMGVPLLEGRGFSDTDGQTSPRVVIVNQTLARTFFPDGSPLDKEVRILASRPREVPFRIVGVVGDIRDESLSAPAQPTMYIPHRQAVSYLQGIASAATLLVRSSVSPESLAGSLRETVWSMDRELPVYDVQTLDSVLARSVARPRFTAVMLGLFSSIALILAIVGVYGLIAQLVSQRVREFGIRFALGATERGIVRLVVSRALLLIMAGLAAGLVLALWSSRVLANLLFGIGPIDPMSFFGTALLLTAAALLASYLPARRAAKTNPTVALRTQ